MKKTGPHRLADGALASPAKESLEPDALCTGADMTKEAERRRIAEPTG